MERVVFSSKKANPNVIKMAYSPGRSIFPWCIGRKNRGSKISPKMAVPMPAIKMPTNGLRGMPKLSDIHFRKKKEMKPPII